MSKNTKFTAQDCEEWKRSPGINPKTKGRLYKNAGVYKELVKQCGSPSSPSFKKPAESEAKKPVAKPAVPKPVAGSPSFSKKPVSKTISPPKPVAPKSVFPPKPVAEGGLSNKKKPVPIQNREFKESDCEKWRANKLVNPITDRSIQPGKALYKRLERDCGSSGSPVNVKTPGKDPIKTPKSPLKTPKSPSVKTPAKIPAKRSGKNVNDYSDEDCTKWHLNKKIDPKTGKRVYANKGRYLSIEEECKDRGKGVAGPSSPKPSSKSKSPVSGSSSPKSKSKSPLPSSKPTSPKNTSSQKLFKAIESGNIKEVQRLVKSGANLEARDKEGSTPLQLAAWGGNISIVQSLVEAGANIKAVDEEGYTPLHFAVMYGRNIPVIQYLIESGADLEAKDYEGMTPLHRAIWHGGRNLPMVEYLVEAGANLEAKDNSGLTPLHLASKKDPSIVEYLLEKRADYTARTNNGETAKDIANLNGYRIIVEILQKWEDDNAIDIKEPAAGHSSPKGKSPVRSPKGKSPVRRPKGKSPISSSPSSPKSPTNKSRPPPPSVPVPAIPTSPKKKTPNERGKKKENPSKIPSKDDVRSKIDAIFRRSDVQVSHEQIQKDFASCIAKINK